MATYVTSRTLTPINKGGRIAPTYNGYSFESNTGESVPIGDRNFIGNTGLTPSLIIGSRQFTIDSHKASGSLGVSLLPQITNPQRKFSILNEFEVGTRLMKMVESDLFMESRVNGERVNIIRSGVGTFGIQYQQTIIQSGEKRVRRWPREWHGDNMKD